MRSVLHTALTEELDALTPPTADLERVVRAGTRRRRRRRAGVAIVAAGAVAAVAIPLAGGPGTTRDNTTVPDYANLGPLDFDGGLRAYADPGGEVRLGGRTFDGSDLEYLDTDATATPFGIVFYADGRPMLLGESGEVTALVRGPVEYAGGFHPTAKADSREPLVAWATMRDGLATVTVRDMSTGTDVGSLDVECGDCDDLVIDALDDGVVFIRTDDGTSTWRVGEDEPVGLAGPDTTIADVRGGVLLHDGPAPSSGLADRYRAVAAPIDAQLTFDGRHVLYWSSVLEPTRPGDEPVRLGQGPAEGLGFWNVDTDGSILVAAPTGKYPEYTVFDCEVASGTCAELGPLTPTGGDPMFIGNDM